MSQPPFEERSAVTGITLTPLCSASVASPTQSSIYYLRNFDSPIDYSYTVKRETEKEKIQRIAREKMHASWKLFQQTEPKVIKVKQVCKPHHRIRNLC